MSRTHLETLDKKRILNIAADKAHTIGRRAVWRDYVDIYFLLKDGYVTLDSVIKLAKQKFAGEFVPSQFLEQLSYFEDLRVVPMEYIQEKPTPYEIKSFLENQVKEYLKKYLS